MKILLDMNLTPKWRVPLEQVGHEIKHWSEIGSDDASDAEIMQWARQNSFVIFTNDLDFGALLYSTAATAPSVIQIRGQDVRPVSMKITVLDALIKAEKELLAGALLTVDTNRRRISVLPLQR